MFLHVLSLTVFHALQIYDMPESQVKLNDVAEFIGVYTFDPELAAPNDNSDDIMFDLIEDVTAQLPPSKVCLLECMMLDFMCNTETSISMHTLNFSLISSLENV